MKVEIEKLDNLGRGITHYNNKICFVENSLPNELVEINIKKEKSKNIEATVKKYITKSKIRIEEECPYSSICGGCNLNHINYDFENNWKKDEVSKILYKYAKINKNTIKDINYHNRNNYRNKIILHGKNNKLGLYEKSSHKIIPIKECLLVTKKINNTIKLLNEVNEDIEETIIQTSNDDNYLMITIKGKVKNINKILEIADVLYYNNNYITENKQIITKVANRKYYRGINSFFQINNTLTKDLYDKVLETVKEKKYINVLDLYCGTGTIGIYISKYCKKIIGIDSNYSNIEDAIKNKELNKINNIDFICDTVENKIQKFKNIDLIIVDPPRNGLDKKVIKNLHIINPKTIIYVSCNPITLARDLNNLKEKYEIKKINLFNMFPRTYHCESVCILERR